MKGGIASSNCAPAVQHADTVGAQHLMAGEGGIVDVESVEVDGLVRHRLAGVEQRQRADGPGPRHQLGDRRDGTRHVRVVTERHHLDPLVQLERVEVDAAVVGDAVPAQRGAGATSEFLPRDQVGMVLEFGGDDDVAGADGTLEAVVAQRIRHQVDRLGGVLGEDQLVGIGADEGRDVVAPLFVGVGGLLHQLMGATVHGPVRGGQERPLGVEHLQRPLRRRAGIQVGQLISTAHDPAQDREVRADPGHLSGIQCPYRGRHVRPRWPRPA